jgi:hypothetical protein
MACRCGATATASRSESESPGRRAVGDQPPSQTRNDSMTRMIGGGPGPGARSRASESESRQLGNRVSRSGPKLQCNFARRSRHCEPGGSHGRAETPSPSRTRTGSIRVMTQIIDSELDPQPPLSPQPQAAGASRLGRGRRHMPVRGTRCDCPSHCDVAQRVAQRWATRPCAALRTPPRPPARHGAATLAAPLDTCAARPHPRRTQPAHPVRPGPPAPPGSAQSALCSCGEI